MSRLTFSIVAIASLTLSEIDGGPLMPERTVAIVIIGFLYKFTWMAFAPVLSVFLFWLSFPPFNLPLYYICYTPLVWLWRNDRSSKWILAVRGGFVPGFTMIWVSGANLRGLYCDVNPVLIHGLAACVFGLQTCSVALVVCVFKTWRPFIMCPIAALVAVLWEIFRLDQLGWPFHLLCLPAATTPIAQWAVFFSCFGVSYFLYLFNFLCLPRSWHGYRGWSPTCFAVCILVFAWMSGLWIRNNIDVQDIPLKVILVQPHDPSNIAIDNIAPETSVEFILNSLTHKALNRFGVADLIVWPETSLKPSYSTLSQDESHARFTLQDFYQRLFPSYQAACVVGFFSQHPQGKLRDTATLIDRAGLIQHHDRLRLAAFSETPPPFLTVWPFKNIWGFLGMSLESSLADGYDTYSLKTIRNSYSENIKIGVSICYEVNFPLLPQYNKENGAVAIFHITDESDYRKYPYHFQHATWHCQYRAIESRKWQFVSGRWSNSAVINPRGDIVSFLGTTKGALSYGY